MRARWALVVPALAALAGACSESNVRPLADASACRDGTRSSPFWFLLVDNLDEPGCVQLEFFEPPRVPGYSAVPGMSITGPYELNGIVWRPDEADCGYRAARSTLRGTVISPPLDVSGHIDMGDSMLIAADWTVRFDRAPDGILTPVTLAHRIESVPFEPVPCDMRP